MISCITITCSWTWNPNMWLEIIEINAIRNKIDMINLNVSCSKYSPHRQWIKNLRISPKWNNRHLPNLPQCSRSNGSKSRLSMRSKCIFCLSFLSSLDFKPLYVPIELSKFEKCLFLKSKAKKTKKQTVLNGLGSIYHTYFSSSYNKLNSNESEIFWK